MTASRDLHGAVLTPPFYNDLTLSLAHAWSLLEDGSSNRRSAFHTPSVASLDRDGAPTQRVMILRQVNRSLRTLRFNTDMRSAKVSEWLEDRRASVLAYSADEKIQIRLNGVMSLDPASETADAVWTDMRDQSRVCYSQPAAPGALVASPDEWQPPSALALDDPRAGAARAHFCVLHFAITRLDFVFLSVRGNRRARFAWPNGELCAQWQAP
jgi:hypothetical protein